MARVYNSRTLLDPSMIQMVGNRADQNVAFENALKERNAGNLRNVLLGAGKLADQKIGEYQRAREVGNWNFNDPIARAAREEYIRTGSSQPMMSYEMQRLAAQQKAADDANRKKSMDWHDRLAFMSNMKAYQDETDPRAREILKQTLAHDLENHPEWGKSEQLEAMENAYLEKQENDLNKQMTAEEDAKWQQEQDAKSYAKRIELETNVLPNAKNKTDKSNYMKVVEQLYANGKINDADRKALENEIRGTQTVGERSKKAAEDTSIAIRSEKQKKESDKKEKQDNITKAKGAVETLEFDGRSATDRKIEELKSKYPDVNFRLKKVGNKYKIEVVEG